MFVIPDLWCINGIDYANYKNMDNKKIYIIVEGAQSTGKSTLINNMKDILPQTSIVSEVARTVIIN